MSGAQDDGAKTVISSTVALSAICVCYCMCSQGNGYCKRLT
jgi:hypothetical protein